MATAGAQGLSAALPEYSWFHGRIVPKAANAQALERRPNEHVSVELFNIPRGLAIALSSSVAKLDEIQILNWDDITYKEVDELLSTIWPRALHFQRQPAAHFVCGRGNYLEAILQGNSHLELLTLHCAHNLSWGHQSSSSRSSRAQAVPRMG